METRSGKMAAVLAFLYVLQVFFDAMFVLFKSIIVSFPWILIFWHDGHV